MNVPAVVLVHIAESIRRHVPDEAQRLALADDVSLILDRDEAAAFCDLVTAPADEVS